MHTGYDSLVFCFIGLTARLVVNPIMVNNLASLGDVCV